MKKKPLLRKWIGGAVVLLLVVLYSCASIGTPDGGMYDETPPKVMKTSPALYALNNKEKKITIEFDEYIQLENANEKVVVSPPQMESADIQVNGKKVEVKLMDTLKANTTYTIDFADAIVDNNESNPLGDFAFTFSTGETIDTLQVAGTVLDASNLEPVKGMLVGLHSNLADSAFVTQPFERVARTDSRGHFTIRGVAPGEYHIFGLMDVNQNFIFDQKTEMIAFSDEIIVPTCELAVRPDTIWKDTLTVDTIRELQYTHFMPDDVVLKAFSEVAITQYMIKNERLLPTKFSFYFSVPADTLPTVEGLNFDEKDAFIIEHSLHNDTVRYWIKDSLVYNIDTLMMKVSYLCSDTLNRLVPQTDTLELSPKTTRERLRKNAEQKREEWEKELKKRRRKGEVTDTLPPIEFLKVTIDAPSAFDLTRNVRISFEEPLSVFDTASIHLMQKVDTLWHEIPYQIEMNPLTMRDYTLYAEWRPEQEYKLSIDSLAFVGLYGSFSDKTEQTMKVRSLDEYAALFLNIPKADKSAVVEVLNGQDVPIRQAKVENGRADIFFLMPGQYYLRLFNDRNGNGVWDPGLYEEKRQAEEVYYYFQPLDLKAMWEVEQDWDLDALPMTKQKPIDITKQKPDAEKKTAKQRNEERMKERNR